MTGTERDVLMRFLRELIQTQPKVYDEMAAKLIAEAVSAQPYAAYLLVQRGLALQNALNPVAIEQSTFTEFLSPGATSWGGDGLDSPVVAAEQPMPARRLSWVELGLKAMERNAKIIWAIIFAAFALVLLIR